MRRSATPSSLGGGSKALRTDLMTPAKLLDGCALEILAAGILRLHRQQKGEQMQNFREKWPGLLEPPKRLMRLAGRGERSGDRRCGPGADRGG